MHLHLHAPCWGRHLGRACPPGNQLPGGTLARGQTLVRRSCLRRGEEWWTRQTGRPGTGSLRLRRTVLPGSLSARPSSPSAACRPPRPPHCGGEARQCPDGRPSGKQVTRSAFTADNLCEGGCARPGHTRTGCTPPLADRPSYRTSQGRRTGGTEKDKTESRRTRVRRARQTRTSRPPSKPQTPHSCAR